MAQYAVTVVGRDRTGIIAQTAEALARQEMNLADSSMTLLRGHFAMTLICEGQARTDELTASLEPLADQGLDISVRELSEVEQQRGETVAALVTVHGADRLGIVSEIAGTLAALGANITDLSTTLAGSLYVLSAEVDLPAGTDFAATVEDLAATAQRLGVSVSAELLDDDQL